MTDPKKNPVAGSDFTQEFETTEDLVNATVTIEYKKPNGTRVVDQDPTSVNTSTGIITYLLPNTITTYGKWFLQVKIVNLAGEITWSNPATKVFFDNKIT